MNNLNHYSVNSVFYEYIKNDGQAMYVANRSPIPGYKNKVVIYNITGNLIEEISNSLFGNKFSLSVSSYTDKEDAKLKEKVIKKVFDDSNFYNEARRAIQNQLIGGITALLLLYDDNKDELYIKTLDSRNIKDYKKDFRGNLTEVKFESKINDGDGTLLSETIQHIKYSLENNVCYYEAWQTNGYNADIKITTPKSSIKLNRIPVWLIENDIKDSYVKKTFYLQNRLNQLFTDNAHALELGQFEQLVMIDVVPRINESTSSLVKTKGQGVILNTPGTVIDVYSDDTLDSSNPSVSSLSKTFQWTENFKIYTQELIRGIYREYGLTWDAQLKKEPSAKAVKFQKQDLIVKCDALFSNWEVALQELSKTILEFIIIDPILSRKYNVGSKNYQDDIIEISYNFNMIEDTETQRSIDMTAVDRGLMSRKAYMLKWGIALDEETYNKEMETISQELLLLNTSLSYTNPSGF